MSMEELMSFMSLLLFLTFFFIIIYLQYTKHKNFTQNNNNHPVAVGFPHYPFVGTLPSFLKHRHRFLDWSTDILRQSPNHTSRFSRPGKIHGVLTAYPPNVEHMLKTNFDNYPKGPRFIFLLHDFLGDGIFNVDSDLWKLQRKTASYEFNTKSLRNFVMETVGIEISTRLIPLLNNASSESNRVFDLQDLLERFAFDSICRLAFNFDPECLKDDGGADGGAVGKEFMRAFEDAATISSERFMSVFAFVWMFKKRFNIRSERRLNEAICTVNQFVNKIVESRLNRAKTEQMSSCEVDLLSRFMEVHGGGSVKFLRDVAVSFILAGRDTSSSALTWFFWLISSRPKVVEKIRAEVDHIRSQRVNKGPDVMVYSFDELREMHYLHAAITESMRLYPPVAVDTKACLSDDVLPDGTFVGKGWFVSYSAFAMGRMESIWGKDCMEFLPERWIDEKGVFKGESPYKYAVFHAGPRMCLGKEMAYIQMKSIAASVLEKFDVEVLGRRMDVHPEFVLSLTLRMKGGLNVRVRVRDM